MSRTSFEIAKDLILRDNAIEHVNQSGYPHQDKSYLQYYSVDAIAFGDLPDTSMYGLILSYNIKRDSIVLEYLGSKITYEEFLNKISEYSFAFKKMNIKKGEIVTIISKNIPEFYYSIYALNKLGVIVNIINPELKLDKIKYYLNKTESKRVIMTANMYSKLNGLFTELNIENVLVIDESVRTKKEVYVSENDVYKSLNIIIDSIKEFCAKPIIFKEVKENKGKGQEVAVIINCNDECIEFTNDNINAGAYSYKFSGLNYEVGDKFLSTIPLYEVSGLSMGMHMPLILGLKNIISTEKELGKNISKYRPQHIISKDSDYQNMIMSSYMWWKNLSYIKNAFCISDSYNMKLRNSINEFLSIHNCKSKLKMMYEIDEYGSIIASQLYVGESNNRNELYTVGIPNLYTGVKVINPETKEELKCNEVGEIVLTGKGIMKGYFNKPDLTSQVIAEDEERILYTGDVGSVDENGCIYIHYRPKRFMKMVENTILKNDLVEECAFINDNLTVFVKIKNGYEEKVEEIISELESLFEISLNFIIIDEMPKDEFGKTNYGYLKDNYEVLNKSRKRVNNG